MIESLQSPHAVRVKALLSSKKERLENKLFVVEGLQGLREALLHANQVETLYLSKSGIERLEKVGINYSNVNMVEISEKVAEAMSDAITSQGIIAICNQFDQNIDAIKPSELEQVIYLNEIQDPGNAGTILRTADAMGISAVFASPGSVDFYSPKVVRSTAGSFWHIPFYNSVTLSQLRDLLPEHKCYLLDGSSPKRISEINFQESSIWIFGNEARGLKDDIKGTERVSIKMPGNAESLNLAAAAAIVMHEISRDK